MSSLRAKMRVNSIQKNYRPSNWQNPEDGITESMALNLIPVGGAGNEEWNKSTPSGSLNLIVNNQDAFEFIESMPGREFYIDITEAAND